jgi:hypothetical protein
MDIQTLTRSEQIELLHKLQDALGWYSVTMLCFEDVRDYIQENDLPMPSDEAIKESCAIVARKADSDHSHLWQWAYELASED